MTKVIKLEIEARQQQMNSNNTKSNEGVNPFTIAFSVLGLFVAIAVVLA